MAAAPSCAVRRWPPPLHLLGGVLGWEALPWRERLAALRLGPALRARAAAAAATDETVAEWLTRHGQHGRIREWLWEPLAVAALNQSPQEARAEPFVRVLARMFGGSRGDASMVLPVVPLHEMYALPAQRYVEARGGRVRTHALARVRLDPDGIATVETRGESFTAPRIIAAVPWFGLAGLFSGATAALQDTLVRASQMESKPIVTVNLWYDRTVMPRPDDQFVGLPGRRIQWVFDKRQAFGEAASHLSLVVSAADALVATRDGPGDRPRRGRG